VTRHSTDQPGRTPVWAAGLLVAAGAGVATAHGLYEVAIAARVPSGIAWLYPLITDGLALVAYAATARLADAGRRYAWTVVVLAAGLSGLAQAAYLAGGIGAAPVAPTVLRFGVGAWPAVAAAIVAHLIHLLATPAHAAAASPTALAPGVLLGERSNRPAVERFNAACPTAPSNLNAPLYNTAEPYNPAVQPASNLNAAADGAGPEPTSPAPSDDPAEQPVVQPVQPPKAAVRAAPRDRARTAARSHQTRHGRLPTVSELVQLAQVARGTAATALKELRDQRPALQIVRTPPEASTDQ
jgi:hypothetical protein